MLASIKDFLKAEDGAVTVDWVVLTAAVVGLAVAAMTSIYTPTSDVGDGVETYLSSNPAGTF